MPTLAGADPGIALLVIKDGQATSHVSGLADREQGRPVTEHTLFELASVSKHFTARAVMLLESRGLLGFEDSLARFLPGLPAVRLRHLLWHTSGLPEYFTTINWSADLDNETVLGSLVGQPLRFTPGTRFEYCNSNYTALAQVVEIVAGQPFADFMEEQFFGPLGMRSTQVLQPDAGCARGYADGAVLEWPSRIFGDGSIFSNLTDMQIWIRSLATGSAMFQSGQLNDGSPTGYGFGMYIEPDSFWHSGTWAGYRNLVYWSRTRDLQVVVLSNERNHDHWEMVNAIRSRESMPERTT